MIAVTLLAIFASNAIALPLSPAFPVGELQYILDNAQAKVLLSTEKYADKAGQILSSGLKQEPIFDILRKIQKGAGTESVKLDSSSSSHSSGGMMLYTSGTTNRPVRTTLPGILKYTHKTISNYITERSPNPRIGPGRTSLLPPTSMELLTKRPPPPLTPPPPHPRRGKRNHSPALLRLLNRIPIPIQHRSCLAPPGSPIHRTRTRTKTNYLPNSCPNNLHPSNGLLPLPGPLPPSPSKKGHLPGPSPAEHLWLCSPAYTHEIQMGGPQQWEYPAGTLRHDRGRHGA